VYIWKRTETPSDYEELVSSAELDGELTWVMKFESHDLPELLQLCRVSSGVRLIRELPDGTVICAGHPPIPMLMDLHAALNAPQVGQID
jgi:hypothetical protein